MKQRFRRGAEVWFTSDSPTSSFSGVFEGDEDTGYFYAYNRASPEHPILDAVHIYDAREAKGRESDAEVVWSSDGLKVGLRLDGNLCAVVDFERQKAYCRNNFPKAADAGGPSRSLTREPWKDSLAELFD